MVFECLDNFLDFSLSSRTSHYENNRCYFSVGLPRTGPSIKPGYGGEYWTKMLLDRTIRCIISNLPVYCLTVPGMLLCRTR